MTRELAPEASQTGNASVRFAHAAHQLDPRSPDLAPASSILSGSAEQHLQRLLNIARELRPRLRAEQHATEERGHYSQELHQLFWDNGFYQVLQPKTYGGLQLGVAAFYRLIAEIARGCPSTGWCLCLGAGHALQLASYFPASGQERIFSAHGQTVTASSGGGQNVKIEAAEGGYRLSGTWRYCSGAPHSTHFMAVARAPQADPRQAPATWWLVLERSQYQVLDDWGAVTGMRGSGSNSIRVENAWVANELIVADPDNMRASGPSVGSRLHGDAVYAGAFRGFAEGEIAAISAGLALAAVDELEHLLDAPLRGHPGTHKADHLDFQRAMGLALAAADSANALSVRGGQLYEDCARRSVAGLEPFGADKALRLASLYFSAEQQAWNALDQVLRAAGSSALQQGKPLERYARDALTLRSRSDQLDFDASVAGTVYLRAANHAGEDA